MKIFVESDDSLSNTNFNVVRLIVNEQMTDTKKKLANFPLKVVFAALE